jgi:hypothetical protein
MTKKGLLLYAKAATFNLVLRAAIIFRTNRLRQDHRLDCGV